MKPLTLIETDLVAAMRGKLEWILRRRDWGGPAESAVGNVFGVCYEGLGDLWVGLSHLIWLARRTGRRPKFSFVGARWLLDPRFLCEKEALASEILRLFNAEKEVKVVRENITRLLPVHPPRNGRTIRISPRCSHHSSLIAYQFDGISRPEFNPTPEEVSSFLSLFDGRHAVRIGLPKRLSESFHLIEQAQYFMGVCSGMSHIAATLGKPCFIYFKPGQDAKSRVRDYVRLKRWHPYHGTKFFSSVEELNCLVGAGTTRRRRLWQIRLSAPKADE